MSDKRDVRSSGDERDLSNERRPKDVADGLRGLKRLLALKSIKRTGWLRAGIEPEACESVADHAFYVVLYAALFAEEGLDRALVLDMAIVHDLAEIVVGDLTPSDCSREEKTAREREAMKALAEILPEGERWLDVWEAYERQDSPEAVFVRTVDRCEMGWQANLYAERADFDAIPFTRSTWRDSDAERLGNLNAALNRIFREIGRRETGER